ncbi:hypothetical protein ABC977_07995 [Thioalkalicoccus limnaeus]|uniref:Transposase n=1 Tax=Thioalkalicoccus limnaeus TaxID=120681 RepID=A0ABV4BDS7_9GAMM
MRVRARDGTEHWIYLHIEIQSQSDSGFAQRMFTYNYRLYDRYARPIASLAVLADTLPGWRPSLFELEQLGCPMRWSSGCGKRYEQSRRPRGWRM